MVHGLDDSRPRRQQQQPAANNDGNFTGVQHGPGTIPSKSFQRLQQMTSPGDIDTASIRPPTEEGYQVGNYDETSIRYLGRTNPSKSFKMLQNMTGGNELDVPTTHRRRERKQVQPNSPEQNPDDTVDIRFVGSNIPSRSFQKLQSMVPASPENAKDERGDYGELHYMGHTVPSQSFKLLQNVVGTDNLKDIADESRRRRKDRLSRDDIFDSPSEQQTFMDPRRKMALDEIAKEQNKSEINTTPNGGSAEPVRDFDENAYLSGQIPIVSGEAKPIRVVNTDPVIDTVPLTNGIDRTSKDFDEEAYLSGRIAFHGDAPKISPLPPKAQETANIPWKKDTEEEKKTFDEDSFLKRNMASVPPAEDQNQEESGPGIEELHYMGKDVPSQSFKLLQSVVGKDDLRAVAVESRRRRRERLSREYVFDAPTQQQHFMDPRRREALEAIEKEQQAGTLVVAQPEPEPSDTRYFDEDAYLAGCVPIVSGEAKQQRPSTDLAHSNEVDPTEVPPSPGGVTYLRRETMDSQLPPRPDKSSHRRYRQRAPWERDDLDTPAVQSDAEFDEASFLGRRMFGRSQSFGNDLDTSEAANTAGGNVAKRFTILRRSSSTDRCTSAPGSRSGTPFSMGDSFDMSDMSESEMEKPLEDMHYTGRHIPSKTFQRLQRMTNRRRPTSRTSHPDPRIRLKEKALEPSPVETVFNELEAKMPESDKYVEMLKQTIQEQTQEKVKIEAEDEVTDF